MDYAIVTENLSKRYSSNLAVDHVNMHVPAGAVYGFVGENGSGKTTIMRLLMGLATPNKGTYALLGVNQKDPSIYKVRKNISAIIEAPSLVPTMTAKENLTFACMYYGVKDLSIIDKVLQDVDLADTGNKKVKNFSLGMRQRLGIAVLLLNNPRLMLLDEPMNGLDPSGIAELRNLITSLNEKGITFLISSHILSELEKVATHYGFIQKGKLLKEISAEDLAKDCVKAIDLRYEDLASIEEALKKAGFAHFERYPSFVRVFDDVTPLELLTKLKGEGVEVTDIRTREANVEDYYLNLIGGGING
ncbi:MAG: ATP-binding cassette domain-containing protein [Bacilli bacterium]|nr:ATP-binding cassette domain-containing protein [Bacilli bacterium]